LLTGDPEVIVPEVAVVSCDGGRIRTRQSGGGRGVRPSGENGWRETKNASMERMTLSERPGNEEDPCPTLPTSFRSVEKVANISDKALPNVRAAALSEDGRLDRYLAKRPGWPFVRRSTSLTIAA
jgi:hypothetical protein